MNEELIKIIKKRLKGTTPYEIRKHTGLHYPTIKSIIEGNESSPKIRDVFRILYYCGIETITVDGVEIEI